MELSKAVKDVLAERELQKTAEGWSPDCVEAHPLAAAAACYAAFVGMAPHDGREVIARSWPWAFHWWRDLTPRAALVRVAALALDAIDAIDRANEEGGRQ